MVRARLPWISGNSVSDQATCQFFTKKPMPYGFVQKKSAHLNDERHFSIGRATGGFLEVFTASRRGPGVRTLFSFEQGLAVLLQQLPVTIFIPFLFPGRASHACITVGTRSRGIGSGAA